MLDTTLVFIRDQLNDQLGSRASGSEPSAVLANLCNLDGTVPIEIENKVVLSLVNVERDATGTSAGPRHTAQGNDFTGRSAPLNLNLYLLISASFSKYEEALRSLTAVLGYFQAKPVFTPHSASTFPRGLEKLTVEIVNLDMQGLNNLWGNIGGKYLPSVLYKARMLTVDEGWITEQVGGISATDTASSANP
jgi:hypothetical protein